MDVFSYLSVLVSIIVGLGMSHLLKAIVRLIHNRARIRIYIPSLLWAASLFLLFTLVWWSSFSLVHHERWTFANFLTTLSVPAVLYVVSALVLPSGESDEAYDMRGVFFTNRVWLLSLAALAVALSFLQTYLLDGNIPINPDSELKASLVVLFVVAAFTKNERLQFIVSVANLAWVVVYITLLFSNLRA